MDGDGEGYHTPDGQEWRNAHSPRAQLAGLSHCGPPCHGCCDCTEGKHVPKPFVDGRVLVPKRRVELKRPDRYIQQRRCRMHLQ
jgi:hypothetical protein